MTTLWLDLETYSEVELKTAGVYVYAAHPSTEITLFAYALDDGPVRVWDLTTGDPMPRDLRAALVDPSVTLIAHNAGFDRIILENCLEIPD
jgi:DNA polymerase